MCRIARAPMTGAERELRVNSLLAGYVTLEALVAAAARGDLAWSSQQAIDHGIDVETWLEAVHVAGVPKSDSIPVLIDRVHGAEAVAQILKAGYRPGRSAVGRLIWWGLVTELYEAEHHADQISGTLHVLMADGMSDRPARANWLDFVVGGLSAAALIAVCVLIVLH